MEKADRDDWWPRWVWVGECFFWYWLTRVVLDKFHRAIKRLCVCVKLGCGNYLLLLPQIATCLLYLFTDAVWLTVCAMPPSLIGLHVRFSKFYQVSALHETPCGDAIKFRTLFSAFIVDETPVIRLSICWALLKLRFSDWWQFLEIWGFPHQVFNGEEEYFRK